MTDMEDDKLIDKLTALNKNLSELNRSNRLKLVTIRGFFNGVASGVGATIGLALVLFFLSNAFTQISALPLIDTILKETKLDKVIQYQVQQVEKITATGTPTPKPTITPAVTIKVT